jgi:hypothetical protein
MGWGWDGDGMAQKLPDAVTDRQTDRQTAMEYGNLESGLECHLVHLSYTQPEQCSAVSSRYRFFCPSCGWVS